MEVGEVQKGHLSNGICLGTQVVKAAAMPRAERLSGKKMNCSSYRLFKIHAFKTTECLFDFDY